MVHSNWHVAAVLLQLSVSVFAHGHDGDMNNMDMGDSPSHAQPQDSQVSGEILPSYSGLSAHSAMMMAHIGLMILAWIFVLPVGVMFSIARSRYTLPVQFLFLATNGVGVLLATYYNVNTPDLYENNAHHKIGWIATWVMTAQTIMSLLFLYSGRTDKIATMPSERTAFLPMSTANMAQHNLESAYRDYRWSADSGSPTDTTLHSPRDESPSNIYRLSKELNREDGDDDDDDGDDDEGGLPMPMPIPQIEHSPSLPSRFRIKAVDAFLSRRIPSLFSRKILRVAEVSHEVVDRTILILGFVALLTGVVTFAGWMRGSGIFNGLAHWVKGGIFFWYGLLTLGRWMGCFADFGWAWQVKPTQSEVGKWKCRIPSAEFTESFVIWLYGATNVFLEHLAAWGSEWTAQDLEHVSISIMFFGGGLLGMLVESKTVRTWLNTSVDMMPARRGGDVDDQQTVRQEPRTYSFSLNPVPALVIMLLGIMMSSHHQDSMVSTKVHAQWGTLLSGFAVARILTYLFLYIAPPTSIYPARPPSELLSSFCLISGGLVFMASTRDVIEWIEGRNLMAMFVLTVVVGVTCILMAWTMIVLALKGWAVRREAKAAARH